MKYQLHQQRNGFTLLELLVAIAIFSMLSVMAYGGLQTVITTKQVSQENAERVAEIQLLMMRLSNDLRQSVSRTIRNEYGDFVSAMKSGQDSDEGFTWTRAGFRNPAQLRRSSLQRVAYQLEEDKLIRLTWPVLDRAQDSTVMKTEVLSSVESIELRYMNHDNEWLSSWPDEQGNMELSALPKAVEVTLELADWGKIKRLILLASG